MHDDSLGVFIDTDLDFDDYLAILYLLGNQQIKILGISITGCGAVFMHHGLRHISRLLQMCGRKDIPVFFGFNKPTIYSNQFSAELRKEANEAYGVFDNFYNDIEQHDATNALDGLEEVLFNSKKKAMLLLLGGGTTLARYIEAEKPLGNIESVIYSGGNILPKYLSQNEKSYGANGNVQSAFFKSKPIYINSVAEYNVFIDVKSVQVLLDSGLPITFVTLSATNRGIINTPALRNELTKHNSIACSVAYQILMKTSDIPIFDLTAALVALHPELIMNQKELNFYIEQNLTVDDLDKSGEFVVDDTRQTHAKILLSVNSKPMPQLFLESLSNIAI